MEAPVSSLAGVRCLKLITKHPETIKVSASINKAAVLPKALIKYPPTAVPLIKAKLAINWLMAFPCCNSSSGRRAGSAPEKAGQKIPHIKPKPILENSRAPIGT
jgi:hypothetical protein